MLHLLPILDLLVDELGVGDGVVAVAALFDLEDFLAP